MTILGILLTAFLLQNTGTIEGTVVDSLTSRPITDASVELTRIEGGRVISRTASVGAGGRFSFKNLPAGDGYQLVASGPGLRATAHGQGSPTDPWKPISLGPGEHRTDVQITAQAVSRIGGKVIEPGGKPLAGARVAVMAAVYVGGRRELQRVENTQTDQRGAFRFTELDPGAYYIRASALNEPAVDALFINPALHDETPPDRRIPWSREPEGYPTVYYPGTSLESAEMIALGSGEKIEDLTITIAKLKTSRVRGRILENGAARSGAVRVMLLPVDESVDSNWSRVLDSRDGNFDFRAVKPGSYFLTALTLGGGTVLGGRRQVEIRAGENEQFDLPVSQGAEISGRLTVAGVDTNGANLSSFTVALQPKASGPIDRVVTPPNILSPTVGANVEADGTFSFRDVVPWDYSVVVSRVPRIYMKSAVLNNENALDRGIRLMSSEPRRLEIVLGTDTGRLDGRVLDANAQNVSGARVVLVPEARQRRDLYAVASSSMTGRFQMDVPPGRYKVFAWDGPPEGAWNDPDFMKQYEKQGTSVDIGSEASEYLEIKVIP